MNRPLTALFAALEALLVVGIGIGISLVPLATMWAFQYGLQVDWAVFWRAAVDIWLLGNGVDLTMTLDPATATAVGFADAGAPFVVSIAALGFAMLTVLLGVRAGRRIAETPYARLGAVTAVVVFAALSFGVTVSALHEFAMPSLWQGTVFPTLVFGFGLLVGGLMERRSALRLAGPAGTAIQRGQGVTGFAWWASQPDLVRVTVKQSARGGVAALSMVMAVSAVALAVMIFGHYAEIITLYEGIHSEVLGGVAVTLGELAILPNLVIWAGAWFVGPGFAIGAGSSVGPLGTSLGPLPAVPVLGALPTGDLAFGFLGILVPVIAGFVAGVAVRSAVTRGLSGRPAPMPLVVTGLGIGVVGGILFGVLAWLSGGAAGPGRLSEVGPDAVLVGVFAALEFGLPAVLGLLTGRPPRDI